MCAYDENIIKDFLERYDYWYSDKEGYGLVKKDYLESQKFLKKFLEKFPLEKVEEMTLKEYATGRGNQEKDKSFCYWVETKLRNLGEIRGGRLSEHQRFGIYYDARNGEYKFKNSNWKNPRFGNSVAAVYEEVHEAIISLLEAAQKHDYEKIEKNKLNPLFKNKLTFLYDAENWIPIYGDSDLDIILTLLSIPFDKETDRVYKRKKLFEFYKALNRPDISTTLFMLFIYSNAGYKYYLRKRENDTFNGENGNKCVKESFNKNEYIINKDSKTRYGMYKGHPNTEEIKRIVGKAGEEIVKAYLESHKKELGIIGEIKKPCENNDGAHHDFSYINKEGEEIYIEVKATKRNNENIISFEMSYHEYNFMLDHENHYYIYYINDALNKMRREVIKEIRACDAKELLFSSKYKMLLTKE